MCIQQITLSFFVDLDNNWCQVYSNNGYTVQGDSQLVDIYCYLANQCNKTNQSQPLIADIYFLEQQQEKIYNLYQYQNYHLVQNTDNTLQIMQQLAKFAFKKVLPPKTALTDQYRYPPRDLKKQIYIFNGDNNDLNDPHNLQYLPIQQQKFKLQQINQIISLNVQDKYFKEENAFIASQELNNGNGIINTAIKPLVQQLYEILK